MQGARGPIIVAMVAQLFRGGVGAVYGTLSVAQGFGAGLGSWASGLLYELTGSYIASFMLAICGSLAGLASFWVVRSLREETLATISPAPTRCAPGELTIEPQITPTPSWPSAARARPT